MSDDSIKNSDEIVDFWLDEIGAENWYFAGAEIDQKIRDFALSTYEKISAEGTNSPWLSAPKSALAYIIVLDQFPRNMFRDRARAFACDHLAQAAAFFALDKGWDMEIGEPERSFFYLPLMHAENLSIQELCVHNFAHNMPETGANSLVHARAHHEVIRRFGRFPLRNQALGRKSSAEEISFIERALYGEFIKAIEADKDPETVI